MNFTNTPEDLENRRSEAPKIADKHAAIIHNIHFVLFNKTYMRYNNAIMQ